MKHKILITLLMMLCSSSLFAQEHEEDINGTLYYFNSVSSREYELVNSPYYYMVETIEVPETVYWGQASVVSIGAKAFTACTNIKKVVLPKTIRTIKEEAFYFCSSLTEINLPEELTSIGRRAFFHTDITSIAIPGSVKDIEESAFERCYSLTDVKLSEGTTTIQSSAFAGTNIKKIVIPNSVTLIEGNAFADCMALDSVTIGKNVREIGGRAFGECSSLKKVRVLAEVPPTLNSSFERIPIDAVLEVPKTSLNAYAHAEGWRRFTRIIGIGPEPCAIPTFTMADGQLLLGCETDNATLHYKINIEGEMEPGVFTFPDSYEISVYATAEGYPTSEIVTQSISLPVSAMGPEGGVTEIYIYDDSHTDITLTSGDVVTLSIKDGIIYIESVPLNAHVGVYSIVGETIMTQVALEDTVVIKLPRNDTYIIKVGEKAFKVKI